MGVLKNDVGRPSNKTIIIRRILKLLCLLIIIALAVCAGYFIKGNENKSNKEINNKTDQKDTKETKKKEFDIKKADKIIKDIFGEQYYYDFIYSSEDDIIFNDNEYKTTVAIEDTKSNSSDYSCDDFFGDNAVLYDKEVDLHSWYVEEGDFNGLCYDEDGLKYYSYNDVNKTYKSKFNDENDAVKDNINKIFTRLYGYSKEKEAYTELSCECGDGVFEITSGIVDSYIIEDELYMDVVIGFIEPSDNDTEVLILKDGMRVNLKDSEIEDEELYKKYQEDLDRYTFRFSKNDDTYKFIDVKKAN